MGSAEAADLGSRGAPGPATAGGGTLRALLYHRVQDPAAARPDLAPDLVSATPARFERHVRYLARHYTPVGAHELIVALGGRHTLPRRAVLVTFDDAYRDFREVAWPILTRYRVPAVLFVPTAFAQEPDRVFWWDAVWQALARTDQDQLLLPHRTALPLRTWRDRVAASRQLAEWLKTLTPSSRAAALATLHTQLGVHPEPPRAVLSWAELRQLAQDGVAVAAHSRTHELLDQVDSGALQWEVAGSRDDLVRELGRCLPLFAYPNGNADARTPRTLRSAGFLAGFGTSPGPSDLRYVDPYRLRRDDGRASLPRLALRLLGPVNRTRALRYWLGRSAAHASP